MHLIKRTNETVFLLIRISFYSSLVLVIYFLASVEIFNFQIACIAAPKY